MWARMAVHAWRKWSRQILWMRNSPGALRTLLFRRVCFSKARDVSQIRREKDHDPAIPGRKWCVSSCSGELVSVDPAAVKAAPRESRAEQSWARGTGPDDTHDKARCSETLRSDTSGTQKHPDWTRGERKGKEENGFIDMRKQYVARILHIA